MLPSRSILLESVVILVVAILLAWGIVTVLEALLGPPGPRGTLAQTVAAETPESCGPSYLTAEPDSFNPSVTVQILNQTVWTHTAAFASPSRCLEAYDLLRTVLTRLAIPGITVTTSGCVPWNRDQDTH